MSLEPFLSNSALLLALITLASLVELIIPLHRGGQDRSGRYFANLALTAITFLLSWGLGVAGVMIAQALSIRPTAPLNALNLPPLADLAITVVVLDLATYLAHVFLHKAPFLWRLHRVHHSDSFVDATTTFRQHPAEGLWRYLWLIVPTWVFGLPAEGFAIYRLLSAVNAVLEHSNITIGSGLDRVIAWVWVTPDMHKVHHSRKAAETDSNYSNLFSTWDRLFGTFTPRARAGSISYGLEDVDPDQSRRLLGLIAMPITSRSGFKAGKTSRAETSRVS